MTEQRAPTTCPTCGVPCRIVSDPDGEGTSYYEPIADHTVELQAAVEEIEGLKESIKHLLEMLEECKVQLPPDDYWKTTEENGPLAELEAR